MKIASQMTNYIPAYDQKHADQSLQSNPNTTAVNKSDLPLGGSLYRFTSRDTLSPFNPNTTPFDKKLVAEAVLRFVSGRIAEHFGQKAILAKNAIWFCFDLKTLHDKMSKPGADKSENAPAGTKLAGDFFNTVAAIPKLGGAAEIATGFYFIADIEGQAYQGKGSFTLDDVMSYVPLNSEDGARLEFKNMAGEILQNLRPS